MSSPRYHKEELWSRFKAAAKEGDRIESLTGRSCHWIVSIDDGKQEYDIEYESGYGSPRAITLDDLYAVYSELYSNGWLSSRYMSQHRTRILPHWSNWNRPGSAMFAVLPLLDDNIYAGGTRGGELHLRSGTGDYGQKAIGK